MQLTRIVIGVDLTTPSIEAATWVAGSFAPDAEVVLLHCLDPILDRQRLMQARESAALVLCEIERDIGRRRSSHRVRVGDPARCLADLAAELDADLIAVGTHEQHPERLPALGSTAERLVRCSPVPVLLCSPTPAGAPRSVLLPLDAVEVDTELAEWTGALAERFEARLALLHVEDKDRDARVTPSPVRFPVHKTPWSRVARELPSHRVFVDAVLGDRADAVLAESRRFGTELVLLQAPDDGTVTDSSIDRVLRRSQCAVLVVPSADTARSMPTR